MEKGNTQQRQLKRNNRVWSQEIWCYRCILRFGAMFSGTWNLILFSRTATSMYLLLIFAHICSYLFIFAQLYEHCSYPWLKVSILFSGYVRQILISDFNLDQLSAHVARKLATCADSCQMGIGPIKSILEESICSKTSLGPFTKKVKVDYFALPACHFRHDTPHIVDAIITTYYEYTTASTELVCK
jgi:hypothetical protein